MSEDKSAPTGAGGGRKAYMDPAHVMDLTNLHLDHPPVSRRVVGMLDLEVTVYGLDEISQSKRPIAIVILAHGFANKAVQMETMAQGLLGEIGRVDAAAPSKQKRDVLVVTLDQRNHGKRRTNRDGLRFDSNPYRLIHMAAQVSGGVQDHNMIMDYLPSFLFPRNERTVDEYISVGVSLGGHITWRLLREDPRVTIGIPIISLPSEALGHLLTRERYGVAALKPYAVERFFDTPSVHGTYKGQKILSLHGELDQVIPPAIGAEWWSRISQQADSPGDMVRIIQDGWGHVVTPQMVQLTAEWIWRWGLTRE